ncbi:unnamed protein product [Phyllotreta striolata]|uniref:RING-type E3 ubiquitin transferase n=1 Tax=Phyllotreta striolata TaxID=444603 RepID=A0A9N9TIX6_PHYSR|nr:unnamed protein product [Phyllotreta striolata]
MTGRYVLPDNSLPKMPCFVCKKPLSYFPIYNTEAGPSCGRHGTPKKYRNCSFRCEFYEELAKNVLFPCCYKSNGCLEILLPKNVAKHELQCKFQTFTCPFECPDEWKGFAGEILEHTESKHPGDVLTDCCFEVDFINNYNKIKLMPYLDGVYLINYRCSGNEKILLCTVTKLGYEPVDDNMNYKIIFEDSGKQFNHTVYSDLNDTVCINITAVNATLKNPTAVLASIEVFQMEPIKDSDIKNANSGLLRHFECIICMDYMLASIYLCATGHSICDRCKDNVKECPTCKSEILTKRNYNLEGVVSDFEFPCKYEKCSFVGKGAVMKEHQEKCNFIETDCPFKELYGCEMKLLNMDLSGHIYKEHNEHWYDGGSIISCPFSFAEGFTIYEDVFYLKYFSKLFKLNFSFQNSSFRFSIKLIDGYLEESSKYCFVVDVLGTTNCNNRLWYSKNMIDGKQDTKIDLAFIDDLIGEEVNFRMFVQEK